MTDHAAPTVRHYAVPGLIERIRAALVDAGLDLATITRDDLARFDEFHTGGRESTRELARLAGLTPGMRVLDVGCGVGGPARTLAAEFGARVTGLDLTWDFCAASGWLNRLVGQQQAVHICNADAQELPFDDGAFDVVWSQNSIMNVPDKARLYAEWARVLRPGGIVAIEVVLHGPVAGLEYPTFWASSPEVNHLETPDEVRAHLSEAGFSEVCWEDVTADITTRARARAETGRPEDGPSLGRRVIVAAQVREKMATSVTNLEQGHIVMARAVLKRAPPASGSHSPSQYVALTATTLVEG